MGGLIPAFYEPGSCYLQRQLVSGVGDVADGAGGGRPVVERNTRGHIAAKNPIRGVFQLIADIGGRAIEECGVGRLQRNNGLW